MKYVDIEHLENLPGKRLEHDESFSFECHCGLDCFNLCCRNLNLFLYPYDIIRLKNHLGITSGHFLDTYVDVVLRPDTFFPDVLLSMTENKDKTCPYLSESGCLVYSDRPDTCRTFPLEHGVMFDVPNNRTTLEFFFRPPDFCLGRHEGKKWNIKTWAEDQDAVQYNNMSVLWAEVKGLFHKDPWGMQGTEGAKAKMAFMATYNIDSFRSFVFESSFLKRYKIPSLIRKKIQTSDVELMKFGFTWVKFFVWGVKSVSILTK
jgi:Fe-S-cluster containining protein